jgi:hypothetical protein
VGNSGKGKNKNKNNNGGGFYLGVKPAGIREKKIKLIGSNPVHASSP